MMIPPSARRPTSGRNISTPRRRFPTPTRRCLSTACVWRTRSAGCAAQGEQHLLKSMPLHQALLVAVVSTLAAADAQSSPPPPGSLRCTACYCWSFDDVVVVILYCPLVPERRAGVETTFSAATLPLRPPSTRSQPSIRSPCPHQSTARSRSCRSSSSSRTSSSSSRRRTTLRHHCPGPCQRATSSSDSCASSRTLARRRR